MIATFRLSIILYGNYPKSTKIKAISASSSAISVPTIVIRTEVVAGFQIHTLVLTSSTPGDITSTISQPAFSNSSSCPSIDDLWAATQSKCDGLDMAT